MQFPTFISSKCTYVPGWSHEKWSAAHLGDAACRHGYCNRLLMSQPWASRTSLLPHFIGGVSHEGPPRFTGETASALL